MGDLVRGKPLLAPRPQFGSGRTCVAIERYPRRAETLAPVGVGDADRRQVPYRGVRSVHILHLQRRHLVPARLDDVDAAASQNPVVAALGDACLVTGAEPSVPEGGRGVVRAPPVFAEYLRTPHLDLALAAPGDRDAIVVDDAQIDAGQRMAHMAGPAFSGERIGQRHADLGHAVPLQEGVTGDFAPPLVGRDGERGRSGDHEAEPRGAPRPSLAHGAGRLLPGADQTCVDGGHGHEERDVAGREAIPGGGRRPRAEFAGGAGPEGAGQGVHDAVDVVQRQRVKDAVVLVPRPGGGERGDLGREVVVGGEDALGARRRAAGVDDQGRVGGEGEGGGRGCGGGWRGEAAETVQLHDGRPQSPCRGCEGGRLREGPVRDDHAGAGVVEDVLEFAQRVRHRQWNSDAPA